MKILKSFVLCLSVILIFYSCKCQDEILPDAVDQTSSDSATIQEGFENLKERARNFSMSTEESTEGYRIDIENTLIVYGSNRDGYTNEKDNSEIWVMDLTQDEQNGVLQLTDNDNYECYWPRVSPDKMKMLFYRTPKNRKEHEYNQYALWMMDLTTFAVEEVLPLSRYNWKRQGTADWSPDGTKLAMFARKADGQQSLFITDIDGNILQEIHNGGGNYTDPSWSPDGESLCFAKNGEIYTVNIAGNEERKITCDLFPDYDPYWSPDGTEIVFESFKGIGANCRALLGNWALRSVVLEDLPTNETCGNINVATRIIREYPNEGMGVPRWTSDSEYILFHYGANCDVSHLAFINRDKTEFTKEDITDREYGKTSLDIVEF